MTTTEADTTDTTDTAKRVNELAAEARREARRWKSLDEAIKTLKKELSDPAALLSAVEALRSAPQENPQWAWALTEATRRSDRARMKAGMRLDTELQALAEKEGVECARVSDQPLVYGWDAFEVSCDFETGRAQVLFGRELCDETEIVAAAIGKATATVKERHESWRGQPTAELFARLRRAYVMAAAATDAASGARVAIVDLIVPLANLITAPARWRQKGPEGLSPYPRERLVVELHQLRRQAALEAGGLRLELGVATGTSTSNKADVVFVPSNGRDGQYYATVRFVEAS